jgi:hypothetical protein
VGSTVSLIFSVGYFSLLDAFYVRIFFFFGLASFGHPPLSSSPL